MSTVTRDQDRRIREVFGAALPLIDSALVQNYRMSREEASQVEEALAQWFPTFCRRPGSPTAAERLRFHLLVTACEYGHVYSSGRLDSLPPRDENVRRSLELGPREIAIELEKQLSKGVQRGDGGNRGETDQ